MPKVVAFLQAFRHAWQWWSGLTFGAAAAVVAIYQHWLETAKPGPWDLWGMTMPWPSFQPWWAWTIVAALVWTTIRFAWLEARREVSSPHLYFGPPEVSVTWFDVDGRTGWGHEYSVEHAFVKLFNNPKTKGQNSKLRGAHVVLRFFDYETGQLIKSFDFGRWADNTQPGHHDSSSSIDRGRYRDIEPNDAGNRIDIALRHGDELDLYAFTTEGQWMSRFGRNHDMQVLGKNKFLVHVIVKSSNAKPFGGCFILELNQKKMTIEQGPPLKIERMVDVEPEKRRA
jgi:hypothetical protein